MSGKYLQQLLPAPDQNRAKNWTRCEHIQEAPKGKGKKT